MVFLVHWCSLWLLGILIFLMMLLVGQVLVVVMGGIVGIGLVVLLSILQLLCYT